MSDDFTTTAIIFWCPMHGPESQVFCFRACDPNLMNKWGKYQVEYRHVEFEEGELEKRIEEVCSNAKPTKPYPEGLSIVSS